MRWSGHNAPTCARKFPRRGGALRRAIARQRMFAKSGNRFSEIEHAQNERIWKRVSIEPNRDAH
jgi:hypothetical protein